MGQCLEISGLKTAGIYLNDFIFILVVFFFFNYQLQQVSLLKQVGLAVTRLTSGISNTIGSF